MDVRGALTQVAEALYQRGLLSYPRTETDQYEREFDFHALLAKQTSDAAWGPLVTELLGDTGLQYERPRNGSKNDKAHPPIHPTAHANGLSGDEKKVYDYVTQRFLASCATDAQGHETAVHIALGGEAFHASGTVVAAQNYLRLFPYETWKDKAMPEYTQDQRFRPTCALRAGETTRPNLLTEADLVSLMDKNGIGTDATIAEHIRKVIDRQYVMLHKQGKTNYLVPSTLGMGLVEGYQSMEISQHLCKPMLRRDTEQKLDLIANAALTRDATVAESMQEYRRIYATVQSDFDTIVQSVRGLIALQAGGDAPPAEDAPPADDAPAPAPPSGACVCHCGTPAVEKTSGDGRAYWACAQDACGFFQWKPDVAAAPAQAHAGARRARRAASPPTAASDAGGDAPRCACDLTAKYATAATVRLQTDTQGANAGCAFWTCPKESRRARYVAWCSRSCSFFAWADDTPARAPRSGARTRPERGGRAPKRRRTTTARTGGGAARGATDTCFRCNQRGHWASAWYVGPPSAELMQPHARCRDPLGNPAE